MKLFAISDLHIAHRINRDALDALPAYPDDWLIVAGDVGEKPGHLQVALDRLTTKFAHVIWTPGNHDLWASSRDQVTRGQARYDELVAIARSYGVSTPEDPFLPWPPNPAIVIVPMFLLFDYSFRPSTVEESDALAWARESHVVSGDELMLSPEPWPSVAAWCEERCAATLARLEALPAHVDTVLANHWPLRYDLALPPRVPRFSLWSGTRLTETWGQRFRARSVISGHLHLRTTLWRHGVRYDEVSLGYPRDWQADRGVAWYLRQILPEDGTDRDRFVPPRDPFREGPGRVYL